MTIKHTARRDRIALVVVVGLIVTALVCDTVRSLVRHYKAKRVAQAVRNARQNEER